MSETTPTRADSLTPADDVVSYSDGRPTVHNWKRSISYRPASVQRVESVADIERIVADRSYPSPVRAMGSSHSTTRCIEANDGTVLDMRAMNRIIEIDEENLTITAEAGVLLIDAAQELEKRGLQFYVNVELGNLTLGSGSCGGTKDASYYSSAPGSEPGWEGGQVCVYCIGFKTVQADGSILEVTEDTNSELLEVMRSSYGMLGVIYEVTFRIKPISAMAVEHKLYSLDGFLADVEELVAGDRSVMYYMFPHIDRVMVELRHDVPGPPSSGSWVWRLRNYFWKTGMPGLGKLLYYLARPISVRHRLLNGADRVVSRVFSLVRSANTSPADQQIRYPETATFASYEFSIWAFPRDEIGTAMRDYFQFHKDYLARTGYRSDVVNVGYHIVEDRRALFSYTRNGSVLTLDPAATGIPGWEEFLVEYNEFCREHGGYPLFNQTRSLTPLQVQSAFAPEIEIFQAARRTMDPEDRFYTPYFQNLFEG